MNIIKKFISRQIRYRKVLNIGKFKVGDKFKYSWRYKSEFKEYRRDNKIYIVEAISSYGEIHGDHIDSGHIGINAHWLKKV